MTWLARNALVGLAGLGTLISVSTALAGIEMHARYSARVDRTNGTATTPFRGSLDRWVPMALSSFSFQFNDGAYPVESLELLPGRRGVTTTLTSGDGDRDYGFDARFVAVPDAEEFELRETCTGTCVLELPRPLEEGEVLALGGFSFRRTQADTEVGTFAIRPDLRRAEIEVEFGGHDRLPYQAELRVLYVDRDAAAGAGALELHSFGGVGAPPPGQAERAGDVLLHGFELRFRRGAHHLRGLEIDLGPRPRVRLEAGVADEPADVRVQALVRRDR